MNPSYGYQLYQDQRTKSRAEILADDARLGRQAAAVFRGGRALAAKASTPAIMALNAIRAIAAQVTARAA
jgi:hypothetical protein